ncbi:MAG TPA: polysaccharide biosynthesis tyrosine autokinase, partial [Segetibacter sp.]|nr:polysaccharide biosynthesis tyrosine autokinase [Segetibacter sp.]
MSDISGVQAVKGKPKFTPKEFLFKYLVYLPLFIACVTISLAVAYVYLRYQVPQYNSSVSILIKDDKNSQPSDALNEIVLFKPKTNLANEIEILKSASLMTRVVRAINLNTQYWTEGNVKRSEVYGNKSFDYELLTPKDTTTGYTLVLRFNDKGNFKVEGLTNEWCRPGDVIHGRQGDFKITGVQAGAINPQYKYIIQWVPPFQMAGSLASALGIRQLSREATILNINVITEIQQKGLDILNELVRAYNNTIIENKNRVIENTVKFIDGRLILLTSELGKVEHGLQKYRQKNEIIDIQKQGENQSDELKNAYEKLGDQEIRLQVIDMLLRYISNPDKRFSMVPSSLGIEDPTLLALVTSYNQLQLEREEKLKIMPEANPVIQVLNSQVEKVRVSLLENLTNIRRATETLRNTVLSDYNNLRGRIRTIPSKERELLEIQRQQGIKEKLYLFLLQKREESAITVASSISNASAIDPATSSGAPVSPDRSGTYRLALIAGLLIPAGFIYLRELLNDKITDKADITSVTEIPIAGEIGHNKIGDRKLVVSEKDRSIISEQFRLTRTNLQFFITDKKNPVILVTSSIAGEGKTFTSMNLGGVWALANKKTVILELDLRKPKISKSLDLLDKKGISNYLIGQAHKEELPVLVKNTNNLYVVPAGPIPPNPSELMLDEKMSELFTYLKANFDIIIIDSAPMGLVSDAKVLSRFADAIVFVVRQRYTPKKQLEFINELYVKKTFSHLSLLVNDVKLNGADAYYRYGYSYGY